MRGSNDKRGSTRNKSVINHLKDEGVVNDELLVLVNNLTIEDLVAIKLEMSSRFLNNRLYGFDMWKKSDHILKEALIKFAISTTHSKKDAARFLGVDMTEFRRILKQFKFESFFEKGDDLVSTK